MRKYINLNQDNLFTVIDSLKRIVSQDTSVEEYRHAFYSIGVELGALIRKDFEAVPDNEIMLALASEDADWLGVGVLDGIAKTNARISAFWNNRTSITINQSSIPIAPIIKSYEEPVDGCKYLLIIKSIINTSCVIQTQLTRMIGKFYPKKIIILSPVSYIDAEINLQKEFPKSISEKFDFRCFAIDDKRDGDIVLPGIGGEVYSRLGLGDASQKNAYFPELIRARIRSSMAPVYQTSPAYSSMDQLLPATSARGQYRYKDGEY